MDDLIELIHEVWNDGWSLATFISAAVAIFKIGEARQHKRDNIKLQGKLDLLLKEAHIEWNTDVRIYPLSSLHLAMKKLKSSSRRSGTSLPARRAKPSTPLRRKRPVKLNKSILAPLVAAICLFVQQAFDYEIPQELQDYGVNTLLLAITIIGMLPSLRKKHVLTEGAVAHPVKQKKQKGMDDIDHAISATLDAQD